MSQMKSFKGREEMYEYLMKFVESDEFTRESYLKPNWGVSAEFLVEAIFDAQAAESARWMKPVIFVSCPRFRDQCCKPREPVHRNLLPHLYDKG